VPEQILSAELHQVIRGRDRLLVPGPDGDHLADQSAKCQLVGHKSKDKRGQHADQRDPCPYRRRPACRIELRCSGCFHDRVLRSGRWYADGTAPPYGDSEAMGWFREIVEVEGAQ
jgi:hypothetical protein